MNRKLRIQLIATMGIALLLMLLPLLGACGKAKEVPKEPIRIGFLGPLTGPLAFHGGLLKDGAELALDMANRNFKGREIQLFVEDSEGMPAPAVEKAKRLVEGRKIHLLLGPLNTGAVGAVADYIDKLPTGGIPQIAHWGTIEEQTTKYQWLFSEAGSLAAYTLATGAWTAKNLGYRKAVMSMVDMDAGRAIGAGTKAGFEAQGGKVLWEQWVPFGTNDFGPFMTSLAAKAKENKADVIFAWYAGADAVAFVKQFAEYGLKKDYALVTPSSTLTDPAVLAEAGEAAVGIVFGDYYFLYLPERPMAKEYWDAFNKKYGKEPADLNNAGYIEISIVLEALNKTGGDTDPKKLRQALYDMKFDTIVWDNFQFDPNTRLGRVSYPMAKIVKKEGKLVREKIDVIKGVSSYKEYGF